MRIMFAIMSAFLISCRGCTPDAVMADEYGTVIASNPPGMSIVVKEKYGDYIDDTGTVVWRDNGSIVVWHRDRPSSYYPECNFALIKINRLEAVK